MELEESMKESSVIKEKADDGERQRGGEFRSFGVSELNIGNWFDCTGLKRPTERNLKV